LPDEQHEISKLLTLSTSHMTDEDQKKLTKWERLGAYPMLILTHPYGWMFWAHEQEDGEGVEILGLSEELGRCLLHALSLGCDYILFDRDASAVEALPTFDW
jgi:hypothetical protein